MGSDHWTAEDARAEARINFDRGVEWAKNEYEPRIEQLQDRLTLIEEILEQHGIPPSGLLKLKACIDAMAGVSGPPDSVRELVGAAREAEDYLRCVGDGSGNRHYIEAADALQAALAKFTEEGK